MWARTEVDQGRMTRFQRLMPSKSLRIYMPAWVVIIRNFNSIVMISNDVSYGYELLYIMDYCTKLVLLTPQKGPIYLH